MISELSWRKRRGEGCFYAREIVNVFWMLGSEEGRGKGERGYGEGLEEIVS